MRSQNDPPKSQANNGKTEISVAKIGLISAITVAAISVIGTVLNAYFSSQAAQAPIIIPIQATQTAEAKATLTAGTSTLATQVPATQTVNPLQIIFQDNFSTDTGWDIGQDSEVFRELVNQHYRYGVLAPNITHWTWRNEPVASDFRLRVDVNLLTSSEETYSAGVLFRGDLPYTGEYWFGIDNKGEFEFYRRTPSGGEHIIGWTASDAIRIADWNALEVWARGSEIDLFINAVKVASRTDETSSKGVFGFYVSTFGGGQEAIAEFDNLVVQE